MLSYAYARAGKYPEAKAKLTEMLTENPNFSLARELLNDVIALQQRNPQIK